MAEPVSEVPWWWTPWRRIAYYRECTARAYQTLDAVAKERSRWREAWARESRANQDLKTRIAVLQEDLMVRDLLIAKAAEKAKNPNQRELPLADMSKSSVGVEFSSPPSG